MTAVGYRETRNAKISKQKTLCYNRATMFNYNYNYFANNDNNNDDPCIVGRSFAG